MKPAESSDRPVEGVYQTTDKFTLEDAHALPRRVNATERPHKGFDGQMCASVERKVEHKGGRRRKVRSMGRYPFLAMIPKYLQDYSAVLSPTTLKDRERRLKELAQRIESLKEKGLISTTSPQKFTRNDAVAIVKDLRKESWKPNYLEQIVSTLKNFATYCGNPVFQELAAKRMLPRSFEPRPTVLSIDQTEAILRGAEKIKGWHGELAKFLCAMYLGTGVRASELRLARFEDLDAGNWVLRIEHPKGELRYSPGRLVPILPDARPAVLRFLAVRKDKLEKAGIAEAEPLVPSLHEGKAGYYTAPGFRRVKLTVEAVSGVRFRIKDFRPTFAQRVIDRNPNLLSSVSKVLGHSNTFTTEKYYARIGDATALRRLQEAYERPELLAPPRPQSSLIERKTPMTGYA